MSDIVGNDDLQKTMHNNSSEHKFKQIDLRNVLTLALGNDMIMMMRMA